MLGKHRQKTGRQKYKNNVALCLAVFSLFGTLAFSQARADSINVAVASNFINPAKLLASRFMAQSGHQVNISAGSTGKLYTQIINGAPFDVFLAANVNEPERLEQQGLALKGMRFTYAVGRLAVWSADQTRIRGDCGNTLKQNDYRKLAIANPRVAPYGKEAVNVLRSLGIYASVKDKLIMGESIGQAFRFVSSQNADLGIISLSQINDPKNTFSGSHCIIEETLHQPLLQQAVVLKRAANNKAVNDFARFLKSNPAREVVLAYGYSVQ